MKHIFKLLLVLTIIVSATTVNAQKFGHLNFAELYAIMPGQAEAQVAYQAFAEDLKINLETMQAELQQKYQDYQANLATMSDIIKQNKEQEIQDLQGRIEAFNYSAQQELSQKEIELTTPIIEKAQAAVKKVAEENTYSYVFNTAEGLVLYAIPSDDIMPLVKKELGIE